MFYTTLLFPTSTTPTTNSIPPYSLQTSSFSSLWQVVWIFLSQLQPSPPEAGKLRCLRPHVACVLSKAWSPPRTCTAWDLGEKQSMLVLLLKIDKHSQGRFWFFLYRRLVLSIVNAKQQCQSLHFQGLSPLSDGLVLKHTSAWPIPTGGDELPWWAVPGIVLI